MTIPPAAIAVGYNTTVIDSAPLLTDVSMDGLSGPSQWYNGTSWTPPASQPSPSCYSSAANGALYVGSGGQIAAVDRNNVAGSLPTLSGATGFYIEFTAQLTGQNLDYKPAFWLMPIEHKGLSDHYEDLNPGQPTYERWQEFDVHEGGWGGFPGFKPTCISWAGIYPSYTNTQTQFGWNAPVLDQTANNTYALLWNPLTLVASFYLNNVLMYTAVAIGISPVVTRQHFFPLISANKGARGLAYKIKVNHVRAFIP